MAIFTKKYLTLFFVQVDHFEGIHAMPDEVEKVDGAPNFRQVIFSYFLAQPGTLEV